MAGYRLVITERKPLDPAAMYPRGAEIMEAFAKVAEIEVKAKVWNYSMFVYRGIRPKPTFSKSERAWIGTADMDDFSITLSNAATNKRGTVYAPYVHLTGKTERLSVKVRAYLRDVLAPKMARAMSHDMIKARSQTRTRTVGGL